MKQAHEINYSAVLRYLERRYPGFAQTAYEEFVAQVEPVVEELSGELIERLHELSLEWSIFDLSLDEGSTGIELYCRENPDRRGNGYIRQLCESADKQISSMFSIERIDIAAHRLELEDVFTGDRFSVRDFLLSEGLYQEGQNGPCGILLTRLTSVRGSWFFPGNPIAFYPVVMAGHMKELLRDDVDERPSFVELVRQVYGPHQDSASGSVESQFFDADIRDAGQLAALRDELEGKYRMLAKRFGLKTSWDRVIADIAHEDGQLGPAELMQRSLGGFEDLRFETMEDLNEIVNVWMAAWNIFPHDSMGGKAPVELSRR